MQKTRVSCVAACLMVAAAPILKGQMVALVTSTTGPQPRAGANLDGRWNRLLSAARTAVDKGQYAEADLAYTDFLSLHPTNENIPYVMYQIGLCHYNQILSIDRDQSDTLRSLGDFERLIARYPTSKFAFMAEKKVRECRQKLAEKEFSIGEFYFKRERYKAAIQRFEALTKNYSSLGFDYQTGIYLTEARKRLVAEEARKAKGEIIKKKEGTENRVIGGW